MPRTSSQTVTIANAGTVSTAVRIDPAMVTGVVMPSAFTGTALAIHGSLTFDGTYQALFDSDGNAVSLGVAASRSIGLSGAEAAVVAAFPFLKVVSNAAEAAERVITIVTRL